VLYESSSTTGVANTPIQGADGNLYGTGSGGTYGEGTVFKLTPDGGLTVLYNFSGPDGSAPSQLIQATDGNFYGTTSYGGVYGSGTVFRITPKGALTTLYSFTGGNDGSGPDGGVTQAVSENFPASIFYGTTGGGVYGYGTIYKFAAAGALTTLHSFDGSDGSYPQAPLVQGTDGNFYGTTDVGGPNTNDGTIFQITPLGNFTLLHNFDGGDGAYLFGSGLVQRTDGTFFGTSESGGDTGCGTIYSLSMGLGPFVKTLPQFGRPGITIKILGTNLTGATSVTFNGRAASFSVGSPTEISAVVPAGATTGKLQVTIPGGRLLSSGPFVVLP